jgi:hypothetical protein
MSKDDIQGQQNPLHIGIRDAARPDHPAIRRHTPIRNHFRPSHIHSRLSQTRHLPIPNPPDLSATYPRNSPRYLFPVPAVSAYDRQAVSAVTSQQLNQPASQTASTSSSSPLCLSLMHIQSKYKPVFASTQASAACLSLKPQPQASASSLSLKPQASASSISLSRLSRLSRSPVRAVKETNHAAEPSPPVAFAK